MNYLKNLFGSSGSKASNNAPDEVDEVILPGHGSFDLEIVGESFYQDALEKICLEGGIRSEKV